MKLYNTLTKQVEEFVPHKKEEVTLYTCGPTVYNYAHIGNLRTYIFEDILEKTLRYIGYNVKRVMNITDVGHLVSDADAGEDKMLISAKKEGKTMAEIADFYTKIFFDDITKLNIRKPDIIQKATDHIDQYIKMIKKLLEEGYAYQAGGNVYFDISRAKEYYQLSGKKEEDLLIGVRDDVTEDKNKRNPFDFGLWFTKSKFEEQEMKWESPWGLGYPGWHIECSGISIKYLGEYLDIHCGGVDNIFPHHTNEIVQSEAYLGHKWCNFWVHGEHLNDKTGKMSKSKGEFLTITLLESKGYQPIVYRFFCLQSHYRKQLVFTYESLDIATTSYNKLKSRVNNIENDDMSLDNNIIKNYQNKFKDALRSDLNTANALTCIYDLLKDNNVNNNTKLYLIKDFDKVLSLNLLDNQQEISPVLEKEINDLIKEREIAKNNKDYQKADQIRDTLSQKGVIVKDNKEGTIWELKK
jgi:cysteinyl-tRNA synthetase